MDDSVDNQANRNETTNVQGGPAAPTDIEDAGADDFATRNVLMSNALPGNATPVAGALTGDGDKFLEPTTADERTSEIPETDSVDPRGR